VVVSGLPASGKTTLGRQLAGALDLPLIDKDEILESLFDSRGIGDASWRRKLSRESDADWIPALSRRVVHVVCECPRDLAAQRFARRKRHAGHRDGSRPKLNAAPSPGELSHQELICTAELVSVDTSEPPELGAVVRRVQDAFARCPAG
jgi:predicted kinase